MQQKQVERRETTPERNALKSTPGTFDTGTQSSRRMTKCCPVRHSTAPAPRNNQKFNNGGNGRLAEGDRRCGGQKQSHQRLPLAPGHDAFPPLCLAATTSRRRPSCRHVLRSTSASTPATRIHSLPRRSLTLCNAAPLAQAGKTPRFAACRCAALGRRQVQSAALPLAHSPCVVVDRAMPSSDSPGNSPVACKNVSRSPPQHLPPSHILEQQNMRLRLVNLVVLPSQTLPHMSTIPLPPSPRVCSQRTCVMPSPRHSSSHSNLRVPRAPSK